MRLITSVIVLFILLAGTAFFAREKVTTFLFRPRSTVSLPSPATQSQDRQESVKIIATGLRIPWEIAFLPDESMLVSERPGTIKRIDTSTETIEEVVGVEHIGEGGLLGLVLHPRFSDNGWVYVYFTTRAEGKLINVVERYTFAKEGFTERKVILTGIAASPNHDGGRMRFGPEGYLYITTGDAENPNLAQDTRSLNGKILRIKDDGSIPEDNPFGNAVYSFGHRNPQGIAWDSKKRLWSTEHGPSGFETGYDEVNLIVKGGNYGWPLVKGEEKREGMISPVIQSGGSDTWAPASLEIFEDALYFGGLRGETLYKAVIQADDSLSLTKLFSGQYGRLRAVTAHSPFLYFSTSNTDGRGNPREADDMIIRIPFTLLN